MASDLVVADGMRVVVSGNATLGSVTVQKGGELVFADVPGGLQVSVKDIAVHGALQMGTEECPLAGRGGVTLTLRGGSDEGVFKAAHAYASPTGANGKGIQVYPGGAFDAHGKRFGHTWTRLARTAAVGDQEVHLQKPVDWEVGHEVLFTTTVYRDWETDEHQNEVRKLASVRGNVITLDRPLGFGHYGGEEYSGEVALLSRTVAIQGDEQSETHKFGGHTLCNKGSICRLSYVEGYRLGQLNVVGRYPFHFHRMGSVDARQVYFKGCSVHHSYWRAYTIHGTSGSEVSNNVAYDVAGHAYFLEDGVETNNSIVSNLAAFIHVIAPRDDYTAGSSGRFMKPAFTSPKRVVPSDITAAGFYCTNLENRWRGNAASGGFSGFLFPALATATGTSFEDNPNYTPESVNFLEFDGNSAHSSGSYWNNAGCMYMGGRISMPDGGQNASHMKYDFGRVPFDEGGPVRRGDVVLKNSKTFVCRYGFVFWGAVPPQDVVAKPHVTLDGFELYDSPKGIRMLGNTALVNAVLVCETGNTATLIDFAESYLRLPPAKPYTRCRGLFMYDTEAQTVVTNTTFRNYSLQSPGRNDACFYDLVFSNEKVPQGLLALKDITFEGTPPGNRFFHNIYENHACSVDKPNIQPGTCDQSNCSECPGSSVSSRLANLVDMDGTATGFEDGAIMGSADSGDENAGTFHGWWHLDDRCQSEDFGGFWACPRSPRHGAQLREVVSIWIYRGSDPWQKARGSTSLAVPGMIYHFGNASNRLQTGFAGQTQVTGACCDIGWYFVPDVLPEEVTFYLNQMVREGGLVVAMQLPQCAEPSVQRCDGSGKFLRCTEIHQGNKSAFLTATDGSYFVLEGNTVFLRLVDPRNRYLEYADGARLLYSWAKNHRRYIVRHRKGDCSPVVDLPSADWLSPVVALPSADWLKVN